MQTDGATEVGAGDQGHAMYIDLTEKPDGFFLPSRPSFGYLIWSMEIVLRDSTDAYLLLVYASYAIQDERPKDCIWAPPFTALDVPPSSLTSNRLGSIRDHFRRCEERVDADTLIAQALYRMGATGAEWRLVGEIMEFKESIRDVGHLKCYKIRRYAVQLTDSIALLNAADPENLKGHTFLPLTRYHDVVLRASSETGGHVATFRGKPLATHLARVLANKDQIASMISRACPIESRWCFLEECGLLLRLDVAGYGRLCEFVRTHMRTFLEDGTAVEHWLNNSLYKVFMNELATCGAARTRLEGDGFVAAFPISLDEQKEIRLRVKAVLRLVFRIRAAVVSLNQSISDKSRHVYCRAAICVGNYRFGRVGELASDGGELEGPVITEVSRLEQALKEFLSAQTRQGRTGESSGNQPTDQPCLAFPAALFDALVDDDSEDLGALEVARAVVRVKEYEAEVVICQLATLAALSRQAQ
jgi:hypothetical protein